MTRRKDLGDGAILNCLRRATENGEWIKAIPHCLNGTEFSREKFKENILLQYGIVTLNFRTYCGGFGKKIFVPHALSCPKGGRVLARHNDATQEWSTLLARDLNLSCIFYESKIKSRTAYGERNGSGAQVATRYQGG